MTKLYLKYEFDLDNDEWDYQNLKNANKYRSALKEIFTQFRTLHKHNGSSGDWSAAYGKLWSIVRDEDLNPWEEIF